MDLSSRIARIPVVCLPGAALGVPLSSDLLGVHAAGRPAPWCGKGSVDGLAPAGALPSVSTRRVRSRPVTCVDDGSLNGRIG